VNVKTLALGAVAVIVAVAMMTGLLVSGAFPAVAPAPAPDPGACQAALAHHAKTANAVASGYPQAAPAACRGLLPTTMQPWAEAALTRGLSAAPPVAAAAAEAGCSYPDTLATAPAGTVAGAVCVAWNGLPVNLATFAAPLQQAAFVATCLNTGVSILGQGKGWVVSS
jgi:hypothetical protein